MRPEEKASLPVTVSREPEKQEPVAAVPEKAYEESLRAAASYAGGSI
jgi:hypothetical protein